MAAYSNPWRPNHEALGVALWTATGLAAVPIARLAELPEGPFRWLAGVAAVLALGWTPGALASRARRRRLRRVRTSRVPAARLARQVRARPEHLWLGWGFEWTARHAQLVHDLLATGLTEVVTPDPERLGGAWLHGLEARERPVAVPLAHTEGHLLAVGTTGAGKTRLFDLLVTQAVLRGEAVVIVDPKGDPDLRRAAAEACRLAGEPQRFVYFHPAFPAESARIDPLRSFNRATELASRVAALIPSETGNDPFKAFGQMALANVVQGLLATGERPTLRALRRHLEGGPEGLVLRVLTAHLDAHLPGWTEAARGQFRGARDTGARAAALVAYYRESARDRAPSTVVDGLVSMFEHERVHFSKMVASLMPVLAMLTAGELGPLLSPLADDPDDRRRLTSMAEVIERGQVAYVGLDALSDGMVGSAIGSILLADLTAVAGDRYNHGVGLRPVTVFVDEAAEVVNDPFIQLLNKGRGARVRLVIATQTFADFAARTGSEAKARQVLGNVNNLVALRVLDADTQRYVTDSLPKVRLRSVVHTHGTSTPAANPLLLGASAAARLVSEEGELFPAALLGQLPNLHYLAVLSGGRVVKGRLPFLESEPQSGSAPGPERRATGPAPGHPGSGSATPPHLS